MGSIKKNKEKILETSTVSVNKIDWKYTTSKFGLFYRHPISISPSHNEDVCECVKEKKIMMVRRRRRRRRRVMMETMRMMMMMMMMMMMRMMMIMKIM